MIRRLLVWAVLATLFTGCASSKQTVNYGPVPPLRDVKNHFEYLQQRLELTEEQSDKFYDILEDHVTAMEKQMPKRPEGGQQMGSPGQQPSAPPQGGMGGRGGGLGGGPGGGMRQQDSAMSRLDEIMIERMKAVLDKPQYKEYKRIRKEMAKQRGNGRPQGGPPGGRMQGGGRPGGGGPGGF